MDRPDKDTKPEGKARLEDLPVRKVEPATAEQVRGGGIKVPEAPAPASPRRPLLPCI